MGAVIVFLVLVGLVVAIWFAVAFLRGSKEIADEDADLAAGHTLPSEKGEAPTLLEADLSFATRESEATRSEQPRELEGD